IAARGVTLVRDPRGALPIAPKSSCALLSVFDRDAEDERREAEAGFADALVAAGIEVGSRLSITADSDPAVVASVKGALTGSPRTIVALYVRVRSYAGTIGLPPAVTPVIDALRGAGTVVAVSFGNPYLVQQLPTEATYLCAFARSVPTAR